MLRRFIMSAVAVAGVAAIPAAAEAHPPEFYHHDAHYHMQRRFEVVYRCGGHWDVYGSFRDRGEADRAAHALQCRGYSQVRVRFVEC
jgi:hypothetical protein